MTKEMKLKALYAKWEYAKEKIDEFAGDEIMKSYAEGVANGIITAIKIIEAK